MNPYSIPPFITASLLLFLSSFVLYKNWKSIFNRIFFLLGLASTIWLFSYSFAYTIVLEQEAQLWFKIGYCGIVFIAVVFFHYTIEFLKLEKMKPLVIGSYLIGFLWIILIWKSLFFIKGVTKYFWGYYPLAGLVHPLFLIFFIGLVSFALVLLFYSFLLKKKEWSALKRIQIKYIFLAFFVFNFASVDFLPNYGLEIYPFGYIPAFFFAIIIAYIILRYQLLDIRVAITRAGIFLVVYTLVLGIPLLINYKYGWKHSIWLMLILATLGPFI
ncbi:MAG: hypothetical protein N2606_04155, partial [Candidatus Omnitrophica bacterium]|nr:hypothetical protein [Candidatus Omnitrophota bacterium]